MARAGLRGALALGGAGLFGLLGPRDAREVESEVDAPQPLADAAACTRSGAGTASTCQRCHAAIHHEWRRSGHASAFEDPVFRAEYDPAPSAFCADCHAAGRARHDHPAHDGVDCASCHAAGAPEATSAGTSTSGVRVCAGCHQFTFPPGELGTHGVYDPADPLQDTVHEWQRSEAARDGRDCIDCHMPWIVDGDARHRSHHISGAGDPALVRDAIVATATARPLAVEEGIEVTVRLAPGEVGHRVPTGDMFRQLRVAAWTEGGTPVDAWLGRHFAPLPAADDHGFRLRPAFDDRVPAPGDGEPPVEVRLVLPRVRAAEVRWSVELHRMPPAQARARGLDPATLRTPVAAGSVAVARE